MRPVLMQKYSEYSAAARKNGGTPATLYDFERMVKMFFIRDLKLSDRVKDAQGVGVTNRITTYMRASGPKIEDG